MGTCLFATNAIAATVVVYDVETEVGPSDTLFSTPANRDNWTGDDLDNWRTKDQSGLVYLRNNNGGDDIITRNNDANFSFSIPSGTTSFSMQIDARIDTFWEAGITASGGGPQLLIGGDFYNSDDFYINFDGTRYTTDNNLASVAGNGGSNIATLRLDYNVALGTADLIYDPEGTAQLLIDDAALNITAPELLGYDQLYSRAGNQYAGAGTWTITLVPEPSTTALLGLGGLALILRRRK